MDDTYYQSQLRQEEWKTRSAEIKERDNYHCQAFNCSFPKSILEVHHLDYFNHKYPWDYPNDMLITLCHKCHSKETTRYKFEESLFTALKMKGFLACDITAMISLIYTDNQFLTDLLRVIRNKKNG